MSVTVKFESDDKDLNASTRKQTESFDRLRAAERRARTEASELNRLVRTGARQATDATSKWRRQVELLEKGLKDGSINQQEFTQGISQAERELDEARQSAGGLNLSLSAVGRSFGKIAAAGVGLSTLKNILAEVRNEAESLGDAAAAAVSDIGQLQQISNKPEEFRRRFELAQRFQATGALDRAGAARAAFTFESIGVDTKPFIDLARSGVVAGDGIEELGQAVSTVSKNFTDIGSAAEILSKGFAAAEKSQGNIQEVLKASAGVATGARAQGISGEETFAAVSTLSELLKNVSESESRLRQLFASAQRQSIEADSISSLIRSISEGISKTGEAPIKFLGSTEAVDAFELLRTNQSKFSGILDSINRSVDEDVLGQKLNLRGAVSSFDAGVALRTAQSVNEIAKEQIGTVKQLRDAIAIQNDTVRVALGEGAASRATIRLEQSLLRSLGLAGTGRLELAGLSTRAVAQDNEEAKAQVDVLRSLVEQLERVLDQEAAKRSQRIALPQAAGAN